MRSLSKRKLQDFRLLWAAFEHHKLPALRIGRTNFPAKQRARNAHPPRRVISVSLFVPLLEFNQDRSSARGESWLLAMNARKRAEKRIRTIDSRAWPELLWWRGALVEKVVSFWRPTQSVTAGYQHCYSAVRATKRAMFERCRPNSDSNPQK